MEELRNYLNNMFAGVTETPDILRAKSELLQMMEDKYDGLISEGLTEEEARQTVIDEFGNFDEIAKELGIDEIIGSQPTGSSATANNNAFAGGAAATGYGYATPGQETVTGEAHGGPNNQNFGPETEANRQQGEYDTQYKNKYRHFYKWNGENLKNYLGFVRRHAFLVAGAIALCILAPYGASVTDEVFNYISGGKLGSALSGLAFFVCIGCAVGFFIMASRMTAKYGRINKDAIAFDTMSQGELTRTVEKMESARTAQLVIGIILCVIAPASSAIGDLFPGVLQALLSPSILLFAAVGVFFIVYSCSTGNRMKELSKAMKNFEKNRDNIPENPDPATQTASYDYQPRFGMPIPIIVLLVIVVAFGLKIGVNAVRGVGIFSGGLWGITAGQNYDGSESFPANDLHSVEIDLSAGDVVVEKTSGDKVTCEYHGRFPSRPVVTFNSGNGKLTVTQESGFHLFNFGNNDGVVTVKVPETVIASYSFDMSAGDANVTGANIENLTVDNSAGSFYMTDVKETGRAEIDMSAGDIIIRGSQLEGNLELDMSAGDAVFENSSVRSLVGDMSAGDFHFRFANKDEAQKYTFDLETSAGDVHYMGSENDDEMHIPATDTSDPHRIEMDLSAGDIIIE